MKRESLEPSPADIDRIRQAFSYGMDKPQDTEPASSRPNALPDNRAGRKGPRLLVAAAVVAVVAVTGTAMWITNQTPSPAPVSASSINAVANQTAPSPVSSGGPSSKTNSASSQFPRTFSLPSMKSPATNGIYTTEIPPPMILRGDANTGCAWMVRWSDSAKFNAIWPAGYTVKFLDQASLVVMDDTGREVMTSNGTTILQPAAINMAGGIAPEALDCLDTPAQILYRAVS